ncbi:MAG: Fic family protein [Deltaproteobacteria bacterium]|nr:Fic family protein [Deltaproteobacteria bacterium]
MLFSTPNLTVEERAVVTRVEELRRNLGRNTTQAKRWTGLLRRTAFARAIRGSNTIEGYNVTVDDALAAAEGEEPLEADADTWAAITGYRNAMTYILQLASDPEFSYHADLIKSLHFMMIGHVLSKNPGRWRPGAIFVHNDELGETVYEGPDGDVVPRLVAELVDQLNAEDKNAPAVVRAGMAHLNLVMIHPFSDGNGRMARALQTLVLAREGILEPPFCSIEEYLGRNTQAYYDVLAEVGGGRWQPGLDARPWLRFVLTAHYRQARTLLMRVREMEALWNLLEVEIKRKALPERTLVALSDAADGYSVRNATYRTAADVSEVVAGRDLKLLADKDLLVPVGEKRGRSYVASKQLKSLAKRVRQPRAVEDPFSTK